MHVIIVIPLDIWHVSQVTYLNPMNVMEISVQNSQSSCVAGHAASVQSISAVFTECLCLLVECLRMEQF